MARVESRMARRRYFRLLSPEDILQNFRVEIDTKI